MLINKNLFLIIFSFLSFISFQANALDLNVCSEKSLSVGIYEDQLLDEMQGYLYLDKVYSKRNYVGEVFSKIIRELAGKNNFELCQLARDNPSVEVALIERPLSVWRSEKIRRYDIESDIKQYQLDNKNRFSKSEVEKFLPPPRPFLPSNIDYLCHLNSPWIEVGVFFAGGEKKAYAVINWSERQIVYDQFLLHAEKLPNEELRRIEFSDDFRGYVNRFNEVLKESGSRKEYLESIKSIPQDLIWLFSSSPNVGVADSSFPDIDMLVEGSINNYVKLIVNLFDACYMENDYRKIKIGSILDANEYIDISSYKVERSVPEWIYK